MADDWANRISSAGVNTSSAAGVASASGAAKQEPLVYFGKRKAGQFRYDFSGGSTRTGKEKFRSDFSGAGGRPGLTGSADYPLGVISKPETVPDVRPQSEAEAEWDTWEDADRQKWAQHLIDAGVISEEERYDYATLQKWWYLMVGESANKYTNAGKEVDPWMMATIYGGGDESGATASSRGREILGEGPIQRYTQSSRDRTVDLTDPTTAKALVNRALGQALGRHATDEEIEEFTNVLNKAERRNPVITKSRTTFNLRDDESGYDTRTRRTTRGGVDAGQVVMDEAMDDEEYKYFQGATTYGNALEEALRTVGGN